MPSSPSSLSIVPGIWKTSKAPHRFFGLRARATWLRQSCSARMMSLQRSKSKECRLTLTEKQTDFLREQIYISAAPFAVQCRRLSAQVGNEASKSRDDLPSQREGRRSHVAKRFSHVMDHLQSNIFIAGQRLNDLTGYSGIEALKKDIGIQGQLLSVEKNPILPFI